MTQDEYDNIIHRDYVLTLQNDSDFFRKAEGLISENKYQEFLSLVSVTIEKLGIRSLTSQYFPKRSTAVALWDYYGCSPTTMSKDHQRQIALMANDRLTPLLTPTPASIQQPKEIIMSKINKIEIVTLINNMPAKDMSDDQLIQIIRETEAQMNDLAGIKTASKKLDTKRNDLQSFIDGLVKILDAR